MIKILWLLESKINSDFVNKISDELDVYKRQGLDIINACDVNIQEELLHEHDHDHECCGHDHHEHDHDHECCLLYTSRCV